MYIQVVGIDIDVKRLDIAREKYSANNIEYVEGSAESIPRVNGIDSYDCVFSNYMLQWCRNKDKVFKEVHRVLKKEGKFGFTTDTYFDTTKLITPETVSSEFLAMSKDMVLLTMDEHIQCAVANSFKILLAEEAKNILKFADVNEYIQMLRMHSQGKFDMSHFNINAMKHHFGEGEITFTVPEGFFIALSVKN